MRKSLKLLIGAAISALCLIVLFYHTDIPALQKILLDLDHVYIIPFILSVLLGQCLVGCRYFFLLGKDIPLQQALIASILGNSANLVLPVRGGELVKAYLTKKAGSLNYLNIVARVLIERSMDIIIAFAAGSIAIWFLSVDATNERIFPQKVVLPVLSVFLLIPFGFWMITAKIDTLIHFLKKAAAFFGKEDFVEKRIVGELHSLSTFLSWANIYKPLLISLFVWFLLHSLSYWSIAFMLGMELNYLSVLFLLFSGTLAFLLPSAPSGIGVLHASLSSGLVLLGYTLEQGIAYGLLFHACIFLSLGSLGLCVWFYFTFYLKKRLEA